jgi:hypothetical protein
MFGGHLENVVFSGGSGNPKKQQSHVVFALRTYRNGSLFPYRFFRFKNLEESFIARPKKKQKYTKYFGIHKLIKYHLQGRQRSSKKIHIL